MRNWIVLVACSTMLLAATALADSSLSSTSRLRREIPALKRRLLANPKLPRATLQKIFESKHIEPYFGHLLPAVEKLAGTPGLDTVLKKISRQYKDSVLLRATVFEPVALATIAPRLKSMSFTRDGYELDGMLHDGTIVSVKSTKSRPRNMLIKRAKAELGRQVKAGTKRTMLIVGHEPNYSEGFGAQSQWSKLARDLGAPLEVILVDHLTGEARQVLGRSNVSPKPSNASVPLLPLLAAPLVNEPNGPSQNAKKQSASPQHHNTRLRWRRLLAKGIIARYERGLSPAELLGSRHNPQKSRRATRQERRRYRSWALRLHTDHSHGLSDRDSQLLKSAFVILASAYSGISSDSAKRLYRLDQQLAVNKAARRRAEARRAKEAQEAAVQNEAFQRAQAKNRRKREEHVERSAQSPAQQRFSKVLGQKRAAIKKIRKGIDAWHQAQKRGERALDHVFYLHALLNNAFAPVFAKRGKLYRGWSSFAKQADKDALEALRREISTAHAAAVATLKGQIAQAQTLYQELQARRYSLHEGQVRLSKLKSSTERTRSPYSTTLTETLLTIEAELKRQERQADCKLERECRASFDHWKEIAAKRRR